MTRLQASSSADSTSGTTTSTSSSGSSSSSSGSASSSSDSESSVTPLVPQVPAPEPPAPKPEEASTSTEKPPAPTKILPQRRRSSAKPKSTATVTPRRNRASTSENTASKTTAVKCEPKVEPKTEPKVESKSELKNSKKKKSIFSPDNSSESDVEHVKTEKPPVAAPNRGRGRPKKSTEEKDKVKLSPKPEIKKEEEAKSVKVPEKRRTSTRIATPARPATPVARVASSCSSRASTSHSESESECEMRTENLCLVRGKSKPDKKPPQDVEQPSVKEAILLNRKLTRSLSARTAQSERLERRASPRPANSPPRTAAAPMPVFPLPPPVPLAQKKCPIRGCDSSGHLGGERSRHFTWDACPVYHNVTPDWCTSFAQERADNVAIRKIALAQRMRVQPSLDQRAYQLKVKDLRSKRNASNEPRTPIPSLPEGAEPEKEPSLEGFAPEYDIMLFREAQAIAATKLEDELADLPVQDDRTGTRYVQMGKFRMQVWYQSPYPDDAARLPLLYICEFCLAHQRTKAAVKRHRTKCLWRHPPGDEVYRKGNLSVWQVDGRKNKRYCQRLCLLAKFFLDHKTLYYDVEPFLFYVMTIADKEGCHTVGYFSKEKNSFLNYNVSCILTLPPYQRQGYGRLLIDFSYLLTKTEGKVGSPEKPLSDLGLISYRSYWKDTLLKKLCGAPGPTLSIRDLSQELAIASYDIVSTLQEMGVMKYWKGKHIVLRKPEVLEEFARRARRVRSVEASGLRWTPPAANGGAAGGGGGR